MTTDLTTTETPRASLIESMAEGYNMDPNKFAATIKATCIKGACSNEQFAAFLMVAHKHRLNPITKEIYAFPQDGGIQPIVSVDGWHKLANDHPSYDGVEYEDHIENGKIVAITARIYRKDRSRPIPATEYMSECSRNTQPWKKWPARMLRHKAFIQAARAAFGFSGIMEPDEFERQHDKGPSPMESRFEKLRTEAPRPRYDQAEDEQPVRDINDDIEDAEFTETQSPPLKAGLGDGEAENPAEANDAGALEDNPHPSDETSASPPPNAKSFYIDSLSKLKSAHKSERKKVLDDIIFNPNWEDLLEGQKATLQRAAE